MVWLKRFFNFYIDASIHVALAVYALTFVSLTKFNLPFDESVLFINFFGTILGYNFVKYAHILVNSKQKSLQLKGVLLVSVLSLFGLIYYVTQLPLKSLVLLGFCLLLTALYTIPIFKWSSFKASTFALRAIPGLKIFVIAVVWSLVTVFFPAFQFYNIITADVCITLLQVFLLVVALMVPFEIRDLTHDTCELKTLPQVLGVKKTKSLGGFLCLVIFLLDFFKNEISLQHLIATGLFLLILCVSIFSAKQKQSTYYSSFWIEAMPLLWLLLLVVF